MRQGRQHLWWRPSFKSTYSFALSLQWRNKLNGLSCFLLFAYSYLSYTTHVSRPRSYELICILVLCFLVRETVEVYEMFVVVSPTCKEALIVVVIVVVVENKVVCIDMVEGGSQRWRSLFMDLIRNWRATTTCRLSWSSFVELETMLVV